MKDYSQVLRPQFWQSLSRQSLFKPWYWLIAFCLIAGFILRCLQLGDKIYWYDEAFTWLRLSGHTETEAIKSLTGLVKPEDFLPFQTLNPDRGLAQTVNGLILDEPQHTPLYFGLARLWAEAFGDAVTTVRSLSVVASMLSLPAMAWLCWELFESVLAVGFGVAILAVSPFHVIYAQEARPTALWILTILLASAALLRAWRVRTALPWFVYGVTLVGSFYGYLFSGFVAVAHSVYVLLVERWRPTRNLLLFVVTLVVSGLCFLPWLRVIADNATQVDTVTSWLTVENRFDLGSFVKLWAYHLSLPFVDRGDLPLSLPLRLLNSLALLTVRILVVYAFYRLWRHTPLRTWLLIGCLTFVPALMLVLPDLLLGGKRSTIPRYLVPVYLGFELALAWLFARQWDPVKPRRSWQTWAGRGVIAFVLAAGLLSSMAAAQADTWWNKVHSANVPTLSQIIHQAERPLVISDAEMGDLFALAHYLDPKVSLLLQPQCYTCPPNPTATDVPYLPEIPPGFTDVFLYNPRPSEAWLAALKQAPYAVKPLSEGFNRWFWKVESKKPSGTPR